MGTTNPDLLKDIQLQNDYCGVTACHNAGIKGNGINIWNMEGYPGNKDHGARSTQRILDAAPNANVICASPDTMMSEYEVKYANVTSPIDGKTYTVEEFIKNNKIKILTRSVGGAFEGGTASDNFWKNLKEKYNLIIFTSMGNDGNEQTTKDNAIAMLVGACGLIKGKPKRDTYSSTGTGLDFIDFRGWDSGTSFSAPYLAGKAALLCEIYNNITHDQVYEYFESSSEDLQDAGFDTYTGHGLPILNPLTFPKEEDIMKEFKDVPKTKWYSEAVYYCVEKGYMKGVSEDEFKPEDPLTRAQMAQILLNIDKLK